MTFLLTNKTVSFVSKKHCNQVLQRFQLFTSSKIPKRSYLCENKLRKSRVMKIGTCNLCNKVREIRYCLYCQQVI